MLRFLLSWGVVSLAGLGAGCNLKGLAHDQLYGSTDAAIEQPAGPGIDAEDANGDGNEDAGADVGAPDSTSPDAAQDAPTADAAVEVGQGDAADGATSDVIAPPDAGPDGGGDAPPVACTPATCPADQFCDDLSGVCLPRDGTGMISGAVIDACHQTAVNAKVGIAGHRACSAAGKGSFFFPGIPLGRLTVTAAAAGYELFIQEVTIVPGGNTLNIPLVRSLPVTCADPAPPAAACSCPEPTCVTP